MVVVVVLVVGVNGAAVLQPRIFNVVEQFVSYSSIAALMEHADDDEFVTDVDEPDGVE